MTRTDFLAFCEAHDLSIVEAGRDWHDAQVKGAYLCAEINNAEDFLAIKPLLDDDSAYLASAKRTQGQHWFEHRGHGRIYAVGADSLTVQMAEEYADFLGAIDDIIYYRAEDLVVRDKALAHHHRLEDESQDAHFQRVSEMQDDGWLAPLYVTEPGHWDYNSKKLLLSDSQRAAGIWSYSFDNFEQRLLLVHASGDENQ